MCNERNIFKDLLRCLLILYTDMSQVKAKEYQKVMHLWAHSDWDPLNDREQGTLTHTASTRIKRDLMSLFCEPPPGLFVVGDETNMKFVHAIIIGVMDTPYEGGFFYFVLKCPNDYPIHPPRVKLMTTDAGRVRFNPNMYKNGKICLSILGTWAGPAWSPAQQLSSLLVSIQSLMTEKPYFNEPGFTREQTPGDAQLYSDLIKHETLRVAVCGMLENECQLNIPNQLRGIMEKSFLEFYDQYIDTVTSNLHMDGQMMIDPFTRMKYRCQYKTTLQRLHSLHDKLTGKNTTIIRPHVQPSVNNLPTIDNTVIDEDDSPSDLQDKNEEE